MLFKKVNLEDFYRIRQFYWDLIDEMSDQNDKIGWKKGIYPTDSFLQESLERGELFVLEEEGQLCASTGCFSFRTGKGNRQIFHGRNSEAGESGKEKSGKAGYPGHQYSGREAL